MKILFEISGFPVHFFGLTVAMGILAGFLLIYRLAAREGKNVNKIMDLGLYTLVFGFIGSRIGYILFYNPQFYLQNPMQIIMVHSGGLSIHGALIGGSAYAFWYIRKHQLDFWTMADLFAPGIILGQAIGRIGCDVFGRPMAVPRLWGVEYGGALVHPVQIYEALLNYVVLFILLNKRKNTEYNGQVFIWYLVLFSINRGVVEFFRFNPSFLGILSISHLLSLLFIVAAAIMGRHLKNVHPSIDNKRKLVELESKKSFVPSLLSVLVLSFVSVAVYYFAWP